jgi:hypothetical protein
MTLRDYASLIAKSVAETGYDAFRPSACVSSATKESMHVLETELSEGGEESLAREWAKSLEKCDSTLFAAYRAGDRVIAVVELRKASVVDKITIQVRPYVEK